MEQKNNMKWHTSIGAIIFSFIFFWPIGVVLLYLRIAEKNGKYKVFSNTLLWTGVGLILFTAFLLAIQVQEDDPTLLPGLFVLFVIPGSIMIAVATKRKLKLKNYEKYIHCMGGKKRMSIESLAEKRKVDIDTAINDILDMINKNIISGYINDYNELVLDGYLENSENMKRYIKEIKVVKCKECGAQNSVRASSTAECEYCGTILQG